LRKFRGKRRYFRNLWREVESFDLKLDSPSQFDLWHIHLDFFGLGKNSLKVRREHIKAHVALYHRLMKQLEDYAYPYQVWICIYEDEPISDAVYIHSPSNNDYFPHQVQGLERDVKLPNTFCDLIDLHIFQVAYRKSDYEEIYFIQSKEQGIPL
jgi:hypothetical protein